MCLKMLFCLLTGQPILRSEDDVCLKDCHFHLQSLAKNYVISGSLEDPCTRLEFPTDIKDRIQARAASHIIRGLLLTKTTTHSLHYKHRKKKQNDHDIDSHQNVTNSNVLELNGLENVGSAILAILAKMGPIPEIVSKFDVRMNNVSLYGFNLSADLSSYLSPSEQYIISVHKGLSPLGAEKMRKYTLDIETSAIRDILQEELRYGTVREI